MDSAQITELMWKNVSDASSILQKGITFYLAILAGTVGYLFSANLTTANKQIIVYAILSISFFTAIASVALAYGIWIGLSDVSNVATSRQPTLCHDTYKKFVKRGQYIAILVMICLLFVLFTVLTALLSASLL
jgi:hypothetical protein